MKKLFFLIAIVAIGTSTTYAQDVKFGFKGGVNFANVNDLQAAGQELDTDGRTGFHLGAVLQASLADTFAIQPEILYSAQGFKDVNVDYINIPVLAKLKLAKVLSIEAGPQFGFVVSDEIEKGFEGIQADAEAESFDLGLAAGAGVEFGQFFAQVRYNIGFTKVTEFAEGKNNAFQVSVGYYMF